MPSFFRLHRLRRRPRDADAARQHPKWACDDMQLLPRTTSPLVAEIVAASCHTKHLPTLAQQEDRCPAEYLLFARFVIQHILDGWLHQTGGRGSIDDLLQPRTPRSTKTPESRERDSLAPDPAHDDL